MAELFNSNFARPGSWSRLSWTLESVPQPAECQNPERERTNVAIVALLDRDNERVEELWVCTLLTQFPGYGFEKTMNGFRKANVLPASMISSIL